MFTTSVPYFSKLSRLTKYKKVGYKQEIYRSFLYYSIDSLLFGMLLIWSNIQKKNDIILTKN